MATTDGNSARLCNCRDELDHHTRRRNDKQLSFAGRWHFRRLICDVVGLQLGDQLVPFDFVLDPERDVIDARRDFGRWMTGVGLDQMDDSFAIVIQPMTVKAKRRALAIGQADDVAEEVPYGFKVGRNDGSVIEFHALILMPCRIELAAMQNNLTSEAYEFPNGMIMRGSFR